MSKSIRATVIVVILGVALGQPRSGAAQSGADASSIHMRDLTQWAFDGGEWSDTSEGLMEPPREFKEYYTAFYQPKTFGDLIATFQFRLEQVFCDAGMIVHAKDAQHYYLVHFPTAGQQWRAKHFWVAISRVDASGYKHVLKLAMVPQVNSNLFVWHEARVVVEKNELQVWVDGTLQRKPSTLVYRALVEWELLDSPLTHQSLDSTLNLSINSVSAICGCKEIPSLHPLGPQPFIL